MFKILNYFLGIKKYKNKKYIEAYNCFLASYDYKDSYFYCFRCLSLIQEEAYIIGKKFKEEKKYQEAIFVFKSINNYRSASIYLEECQKQIENN